MRLSNCVSRKGDLLPRLDAYSRILSKVSTVDTLVAVASGGLAVWPYHSVARMRGTVRRVWGNRGCGSVETIFTGYGAVLGADLAMAVLCS